MKRAIVFAGQGAQFVGMGRDLAGAYPECRALFERADAALGYALSSVCFEGPEGELTKTSRCQPAIFVTSMACAVALARRAPGLEWAAAAGLSLGEWTALHQAGALTFEDTVRVLEARGRFMQEACEARDGAMMSVIGPAAEALEPVCARTGVEIANLNSPGQTVLSGERAAIAAAEKLAQEAGAKRTVILNVAGAYHSSLMAPAARKLEALLKDVVIQTPRIPVVANVTGRPHGGPDAIRETMVKQVTAPVRWIDGVTWMRQNGVTAYVECGPGKVLAGLIKRIDGAAGLHGIQDAATLDKAVQELGAAPV
jgi:[acyl-carrier-protein] S-malonyltransferase